MDRVLQHNVLAMSGRAVEAAGDVNVLLLDKTGTITLGNRQATDFFPAPGVLPGDLAEAAQLSSLSDETPEGRSIVVLAKDQFGLRARRMEGMKFVPFSAQTRMSGVDFNGRQIRKGAGDSVAEWVRGQGGTIDSGRLRPASTGSRPRARRRCSWPTEPRVLGVVALRDVVKAGMRDRFDRLRAMGIRTIMITGDNPLTAAAIAREAGVDDFLAQATPEQKLALIRKEQEGGNLVAMTGDGTNDAPALAQADVGVAMNTGTQAAREAGNMVDLDSNPTKLIEVVEIGKQLLMTRGSLTTFSIANDVAKYFAILPAMFAATYPGAERPERHAPRQSEVGDPLGRHLQRADHHRADSAGAAGRQVPPARSGAHPRPQPLDLRHRGHRRSVRRDQADRLDRAGPAPGLRRTP